MKTPLALVVAALVIGVIAGLGTAGLRMWLVPWDGGPVATEKAVLTPSSLSPQAAVDSEEYACGTISSAAEGSHDFLFTNRGRGNLTLRAGDSSCKCTRTEIEKAELAPGESAKVAIHWKAKDTAGSFRHTATIFTNDPDRKMITLTVTGEIALAVWTDPAELVFSRVPPGEGSTGEVRVLTTLPKPLEIADFKLSDPKTAPYFDITHHPETLKSKFGNLNVRSSVRVRVGVKPGLPQGPFQQTIVLRTNQDSYPEITIPVRGVIGSEVSIAGQGWNETEGILSFGLVSGQTGAERRLMLITRGPHCREVKFKVIGVDPAELLQVRLGETVPLGNGAASQTPLIIQVLQCNRPANYLGGEQGKTGEILLETGHPQVPQVRISVSFVIEG